MCQRESKVTYLVKLFADERECELVGDEYVHLLNSGFRIHKNDDRIVEVKPVQLFQVVEYMSFFAVRHIPTGKEHPMGDGVDSVFDAEENALSPGTDEFVERWASDLNGDKSSIMEAYFPELNDE